MGGKNSRLSRTRQRRTIPPMPHNLPNNPAEEQAGSIAHRPMQQTLLANGAASSETSGSNMTYAGHDAMTSYDSGVSGLLGYDFPSHADRLNASQMQTSTSSFHVAPQSANIMRHEALSADNAASPVTGSTNMTYAGQNTVLSSVQSGVYDSGMSDLLDNGFLNHGDGLYASQTYSSSSHVTAQSELNTRQEILLVNTETGGPNVTYAGQNAVPSSVQSGLYDSGMSDTLDFEDYLYDIVHTSQASTSSSHVAPQRELIFRQETFLVSSAANTATGGSSMTYADHNAVPITVQSGFYQSRMSAVLASEGYPYQGDRLHASQTRTSRSHAAPQIGLVYRQESGMINAIYEENHPYPMPTDVHINHGRYNHIQPNVAMAMGADNRNVDMEIDVDIRERRRQKRLLRSNTHYMC